MQLSTATNDAINDAFASFSETSKLAQLQRVIDALPEGQGRRFQKAAEHAASILEWLSPALMVFDKHHPLNPPVMGIFSSAHPDTIPLIASSAKKFILDAVMLQNLDAHVEFATARFDELERDLDKTFTPEDLSNNRGMAIRILLDKYGASTSKLSKQPEPSALPMFEDIMVWRSKDTLEVVRESAKRGVASALLSLLSEDRKTVMSIPFCYARHLPADVVKEIQ